MRRKQLQREGQNSCAYGDSLDTGDVSWEGETGLP